MAGKKKTPRTRREPRVQQSEEDLYEALAKAVVPWSSLTQLGVNTKAGRKGIASLVAAGRIVDLGMVKRSKVYAAVRWGTPKETRLALAAQEARGLVHGSTKLVLLPLKKSDKAEAPYSKLPKGLRGTVMTDALNQLAKSKEAFLLKLGRTTYAALTDNLRTLLDGSSQATSAAKPGATTASVASGRTNGRDVATAIDRADVLVAYQRLSTAQKSPNIMVADLLKATGAPLEPFKAWLLAECRAHRAIPFLGEPSRATAEQLAAALPVDGRPHIYIRLLEEEVS